jgi:PAS domain S-box-containing protein
MDPALAQNISGDRVFEILFKEVPLPLLIIDQQGQILQANGGVWRSTGYGPEELLAHPLTVLCASYERRRFIFDHIGQIQELTEIDIDVQRKNGEIFMANLSFSPFRHQDRILLFLVLRDVTRRRVQEGKLREDEERYRRLLEERNRLEEQLQRSRRLAAIGELSAGVAHEINNPLAVIAEEAGWLQDLMKSRHLEDLAELADFKDSLREILQQARRCREITHNLLRFGRQPQASVQEVDLEGLIEEVIRQKEREAEGNRVIIIREFAGGLPPIPSDPILLRQVFLNFLGNALDAIPGNGKITITTDFLPNQGVAVQINDTGCGIPPENLTKIFDPFFTTKSPGKGTGLGLSLSHTILEKLGGRVSVKSQVGRGTTFSIQLPLTLEKGEPKHATQDSTG